jgi:hypothetical protein
MTTKTDIEEIAKLLGGDWEVRYWKDGTIELISQDLALCYPYPENNAELHVRWMVEYPIWAERKTNSDKFYGRYRKDPTVSICYYVNATFDTPHEAIRAALIAKLRSEQDAS